MSNHLEKNRRFCILRFIRIFTLFPFSIVFGSIAALRRIAFQKRWFRSETYNIPTVCVGNLRVGGTGKTPHVAYIAKLLSSNHNIAILSRGYGRKTKGYINAHDIQHLNSKILGDEPMLFAEKFPNAEVAVCESRKTGIDNLIAHNPDLEVIILDDAYQHLSVKYTLNIILTEYHNPFFEDFPMPSGNLREWRKASQHADIIIVTKSPENVTAAEKEHFIRKLKLQPHQELFFTTLKYKLQIKNQKSTILLITGIANPAPLVQYLETQYSTIHKLHFSDHHSFTNKNIEKIIRLKEKLGGEDCTVLTTEKDAMRLQAFENMPEFETVPIEIEFLEKEDVFKEKILSLLHHEDA